jgi:hypothetical protein
MTKTAHRDYKFVIVNDDEVKPARQMPESPTSSSMRQSTDNELFLTLCPAQFDQAREGILHSVQIRELGSDVGEFGGPSAAPARSSIRLSF